VGSVVGEDGVDLVGDGGDQATQEVARRAARRLLMQFNEGELRRSVDSDDEVEFAFCGSDFSDVDMKIADRVSLEFTLGGGFALGCGLPVAVRDLVDEALSLRRPAVEAGHVGFGPGLVDKDEAGGIDEALTGSPSSAVAAYVGAILLARDEGLFLSVTPIRRKKRLIIEVSALTPRSDKRRSQSA
jgi:hypothetical protein